MTNAPLPSLPFADPERPRILITRMSAIGDAVLTVPVLTALRRRWPKAFLAWAIQEPAATVLRDHPDLDAMVVLKRRWFWKPRQVWAARQQLRELRVEVAVDPQSRTKSAMAAWLSGARLRIGRAEPRNELAPRLSTHMIAPASTHLVDASLELLAPLGIHHTPGVSEVSWRLPRDPGAEGRVDHMLGELRRATGDARFAPGQFAILNPGATWDSKLWPPDRLGLVAAHLARTHDIPSLVLWAGPRERAWADAIVAASGRSATLAPRTTLRELTALLRAGRVFVSADTGPLHMAVAVGLPSVGLYGTTRPADCGPYCPTSTSTNPATATPFARPEDPGPFRAIQQRYHHGSHRDRRAAPNDAMREITVAHVTACLDDLLPMHPAP